MKKSILSLSAAVALGGLGFITTAGAVVVYDPASGASGTNVNLYQHVAGTGHILLTPYFSAQGTNATLINIVNTDTINGKAVKVRFRGASNSDDVMDFTLLLSPGDVWSGQVSAGPDGLAQISHASDETTCTLPDNSAWPGSFNTLRLPSYLSTDAQNALTREGYVEVLNMADITPDSTANSVFTAIKHVNNKAPCTAGALAALLSTDVLTAASAAESPYDLAPPTGGLMGSWAILNQNQMGVFSGADTAMVVTTDTVIAQNSTVTSAAGNIMFFPQVEVAFTSFAAGAITSATIGNVTADPLLAGGTTAIGGTATTGLIQPLWFDLPDLSTPILNTATAETPAVQADNLTNTMAKANVMNEWMSYGVGVTFDTDWVVSQPTRRYHAAVDYGASAAAARVILGGGTTNFQGYATTGITQTNYGPMGCLPFGLAAMNREEGGTSLGAQFSPGRTTSTCGEVFTIQFGNTSTLAAVVTPTSASSIVGPLGGAGWAQLTVPTAATTNGGFGLPLLGFAAIQFQNAAAGAIYNETLPHRWK